MYIYMCTVVGYSHVWIDDHPHGQFTHGPCLWNLSLAGTSRGVSTWLRPGGFHKWGVYSWRLRMENPPVDAAMESCMFLLSFQFYMWVCLKISHFQIDGEWSFCLLKYMLYRYFEYTVPRTSMPQFQTHVKWWLVSFLSASSGNSSSSSLRWSSTSRSAGHGILQLENVSTDMEVS